MVNSKNKFILLTSMLLVLILLFGGSVFISKKFYAEEKLNSPIATSPTASNPATAEPNISAVPTLSVDTPDRIHTPIPKVMPTSTQVPTATAFTVTSVTVQADSDSFSGACDVPKQVTFTAHISTNGKGTVSYKWIKSNGDSSSTPQTINFTTEGPQTVSTVWSLGSPGLSYTANVKMQIVSPNSLESNLATFSLNCS